jgi:predicted nuclease with TOPRIM domain
MPYIIENNSYFGEKKKMSVTIEQDLKEYLAKFDQRFDRLEQKLEKIDNRLTNLEVGQARLEEKVDSLEKDIESVKEDTKELKGSQKAQIWTLIGILGTALLGTVVRYIILPLPPQ